MEMHVQRFAEVAAEFCAWCESEPKGELEEARRVLRFLSLLYERALDLRELEDAADVEVDRVGDSAWNAVYTRFGALPFNYYSSIFDPRSVLTGKAEPGTGDLADDLADIYRDLCEGLELVRGNHAAAAEWQWCWSFRNHWGRHAASALHAIHCWCADEGAW